MKFLNRHEVASQLKVSANTITDWTRQGRIRVAGWVKNQPLFTQSAIDEVQPEVRKYGRPAVKEDEEPVPA